MGIKRFDINEEIPQEINDHPTEILDAIRHLAELCERHNCAGIISVAPTDSRLEMTDPKTTAICSRGGSPAGVKIAYETIVSMLRDELSIEGFSYN